MPAQLGCDSSDEGASILGLRTLSHALLVVVAALVGALPLTKFLQPVRVPLLAIQGANAKRPLDRLAVVLGFAGASWYLLGRWLTIPAKPVGPLPLKLLWSPQALALLVSALAIVGVIVVPGIRALRAARTPRRLREGAIALALLAGAGLAGFLWIWLSGRGLLEGLTAWHAHYRPPEQLLWIVVAAGGLQVASSLDSYLRLAKPFLHAVRKQVAALSVVLGAIGATLAGFVAVQALGPAVVDWGAKTALALAAFAAPLLLAWYLDLLTLAWRSTRDGFGALRKRALSTVPVEDTPDAGAAVPH